MMDVVATFVVDGEVIASTPPRRPALVHALRTLAATTHCVTGSHTERGMVHWHSFRVLERWGFAMRAISNYVAITEAGRAALARCQMVVRTSAEVMAT